MPTVEQVRNKVLRMMAKEFKITTTDDETILLWYGSVACSVNVEEFMKDSEGQNTIIKVAAPILWDVKRTPAVYEWVATTGQSFMIGNVACRTAKEPGNTNLFFLHNLFGDNIDEPELTLTVAKLVGTADKLDEELMLKFGGKRTTEN
jgi:hypothetical protein